MSFCRKTRVRQISTSAFIVCFLRRELSWEKNLPTMRFRYLSHRCFRALGAVLFGVAILSHAGENPLVTNLFPLRQLAQANFHSVADMELTGTICAADVRNSFLVLQDGTATELVEMEFTNASLHAGQRVRIYGEKCEITRRRTGIGLRRLPLVDNDGQHGVQEKSAPAQLLPGLHPLTVEWFNAGGEAKLSVEFSGPDFARTKIPDAQLSHAEFSVTDNALVTLPGLKFQGYEGNWRSLPDFGIWPESGGGMTSNFGLSAEAQGEHIARVFSGLLTVTQAGSYTFYLNSDDGSKLYLGERLPRVEVIGETATPLPRPIYIGQIAGTNDPGRWATVEGVVSYVSPRGRRLELDLRSPSNNRMQVDVMDAAGLPVEYLLNSKVRLTGVARQTFSTGGQSILGLFTVGDAREVQLLEVPNEIWQTRPLQTITNVVSAKNLGTVVRVAGAIKNLDAGEKIELSDATGKITLENVGLTRPILQEQVEALGVLSGDGTNATLKNACIRVNYTGADAHLPLLTSAQQVLQLSRDEAARGYPVHLRGVITCIWPDDPRNYVLQDATRGVFLQHTNLFLADHPQFGEFWDVQGLTGGGSFAPMIQVRAMERIGDGRLPEPAHAEWDQLVNGSLDNQFVEIEGVVLEVKTNTITLLAHSGKINIAVYGEKPPGLAQFENKLVRLRGCFQAVWDGRTHQVKSGEIRLGNIAINSDQTFSADPFAVPQKTVPELRLFDLQANAIRRVKISGQFLQRRAGEGFMASGTNGLRFVLNGEADLHPGDLIDVAGVPDLRGAAPVLREAVARKTGTANLPLPKKISAENLQQPAIDATRVVVEGVLLDVQRSQAEQILELRSGLRTFVARMPAVRDPGEELYPGSRLRLTGVFSGQPVGRNGAAVLDSFELLLDSPLDIQVLSRPPWWTFKRLLLALGILAAVLALAAVWIVLLRRQVERRTAQLERVTRQREQAERARALDEERLRIARDLHDDLGSSLTEITMLGGMSLAEKESGRGDIISQIVKKARDSVNALDVIVWAVNPKENSLQSLADYLASFADEFLTASGIACRLNLPVSFPAVTLDGRTRHDLFLATKEALNNAVRHARTMEVELSIALERGTLIIGVRDQGTGFDKPAKNSGHGLGNLQSRLEKLRGQCQIESIPGAGTCVTLKLPLPAAG